MITRHLLQNNTDSRVEIKEIIKNNNYSCIDVGAGVYYWTYPECKVVADIYSKEQFGQYTDIQHVFTLNLQNPDTWTELLNYVEKNGKFNYSVCSHTLEDILNPFEVIRLLEKISERGFIAVPSKYDELRYQYTNYFRGNPHHKYIFDIIDGNLFILPKLPFIEKNERADKIAAQPDPAQLSIHWENNINYKLYGDTVYYSNDAVIDGYFNFLEQNIYEQ